MTRSLALSRRLQRRPILTSTLLSAVLVAACQTTLTLNNDNLQNSIATWLQANYGVTATVSCPDDRPLQQGDTFNCTAATSDGQQITLQVTQSDGQGNVDWKVLGS